MIVIAAGEKFDISPKDILNTEAMLIKKKIGLDFQAWLEAMGRMDAEAVTALIWIARKRSDASVRYEDVTFPLGAVEFELTDDEKAEYEAAGTPGKDAPEDATAND
jgi:hypothetical protein